MCMAFGTVIYCDVVARSLRKENSCSVCIKAYCTDVYCDVVATTFRKDCVKIYICSVFWYFSKIQICFL
jgi:hypothetical protein